MTGLVRLATERKVVRGKKKTTNVDVECLSKVAALFANNAAQMQLIDIQGKADRTAEEGFFARAAQVVQETIEMQIFCSFELYAVVLRRCLESCVYARSERSHP